MVPDSQPSTAIGSPGSGPGYSTGVYGLIGGLAGLVLSFIPLSPLLGGAIAGYLEGGEPKDGLKAGAIGGVMMFLPFVLLAFTVTFFLGFGGGAPIVFSLVGLAILLFSAVYTIGLSILGGYVGTHLSGEL